MESQRKKKPKLNRTVNKNDDNEKDYPDGDAKGVESRSAGSASQPGKVQRVLSFGRQYNYVRFLCSGNLSGQEVIPYRGRHEEEGSGKPEHYSASLKRLIKSSFHLNLKSSKVARAVHIGKIYFSVHVFCDPLLLGSCL